MPREGGSTETKTTDTEIKQQTVIWVPGINGLLIQFSFSGDQEEYHILSAELSSQDGHRAGCLLLPKFPIAEGPSKVKPREKK